ncbi:histidinol dehydrogenase [Dermatobacter hominis]|uniref:histidinol dehydrogenase n=1 Tax=Dermatobacter hominis TaxID=2884263 RepID=UPI001D1124E2|nr:histidinol dehydrogenase [Dermatobacter hominis]UDY36024.1 histidinol dehydrogenase [Dermatobacter hominis]
MLNRLDLRGVADPGGSLPRPSVDGDEPVAAVREILADVRERGDGALLELTERFDGVRLESLRVPADRIEAALAATPPDVRAALELARDRIRSHHETQLRPEVAHDTDGVHIRSFHRPVDRVGCYVPGGRAAYPSTLLMTAVPAQVAGVPEVAVCVPPDRETGEVTPVTLAAAAVAGIDEVYAIGGAQAIGALAFGTEQVPAVDVICGPGNKYVALAKQEVAGTVGVAAAFAGPSEVVVVADGSIRPDLAAIDVILQAEHGPDGLAWLISWDPDALDAIDAELGRLTEAAPRRAEITATLAEGGYAVLVDSPEAAIEVANQVAPEHLELLCRGAADLVPLVRNAGAIFIGPWSPASVGDYLAGPSHVLPTYGTARFSSALTVDDFLKHHHVITVDGEAFDQIGPAVQALAEAEGLDAHAESIRLRRTLRADGLPGTTGAPA